MKISSNLRRSYRALSAGNKALIITLTLLVSILAVTGIKLG